MIGEVDCLGQRLCEPCAHLERLGPSPAFSAASCTVAGCAPMWSATARFESATPWFTVSSRERNAPHRNRHLRLHRHRGFDELLRSSATGTPRCSREHRRILREAFGERGGTEIDTQGDLLLLVPRARDAVRRPWRRSAPRGPRVAGGQAGPGADGHSHRRAAHWATRAISAWTSSARPGSLAAGRGGQILISETTRALVGNQLPDGVDDARPRPAAPEGRPA